MSLEVFLTLVGCISAFTALVVEAGKDLFPKNRNYNVTASIVSFVTTIFVCMAYVVFFEQTVDNKLVICFIAVAVCSWLSSMLGFDKIKQTLIQLGVDKWVI